MANQIEKIVEKMALEFLKDTNIELIDVEYIKEHHWYLRVFIDKEGGIEIEDCQQLSEQLEEKLDTLDPIKDNYFLEVSSPGLDRILKKEKDFQRQIGSMVEVTTYLPINGEKVTVGKLTGYTEDAIILEDISIPRDKAASVRLHLEF